MSNYEATGHIQEIFKIQSGVSKAGKEYKKREFLIETEGQYPKNICFNLFGNNVDFLDNLKIGDLVKVMFDVESREYNGKWYHNLNAFNVSNIGDQQQPDNELASETENVPFNSEDDSGQDDLPF